MSIFRSSKQTSIAFIAYSSFFFPDLAMAWRVYSHPNCPLLENPRRTSWRDYMMHRVPDAHLRYRAGSRYRTGPARKGLVGVEFNLAVRVNDPESIGWLDPSRCYSVFYNLRDEPAAARRPNPNNAYRAGYNSHWIESHPKQPRSYAPSPPADAGARAHISVGAHYTVGALPGNPENYEINVLGVLLLFDEQGRVWDRRGNHVGRLVCYASNECGRFAYPPPQNRR